YLQRLMARVQSPATGVRPLVRPLFAPPPEPFREVATEAFAQGPEHASRATTRTESIPPAPDIESTRAASPQPLLPRVSEEPPKPAPPRRPATPASPRAAPPPEHAQSEAAALPPPSRGATHTTSFVHPVQVSRDAVQPLMPPVAIPARAPVAMPPPPAQPPLDDIQIHIGRIEVHAVPPAPAPRAVLPKPRHGVNLDDYLKRGRGRTR